MIFSNQPGTREIISQLLQGPHGLVVHYQPRLEIAVSVIKIATGVNRKTTGSISFATLMPAGGWVLVGL